MPVRYRWNSKQLREHISVLDGKLSPTILLKNACYLNQTFRKWITSNIWIYKDRIVYVGDKLPEKLEECDVFDCTGYFLVPGYIEPHAHPSQLYNPHTLAKYSSQFGTTTLINDNMVLMMQLDKTKSFSFLSKMQEMPTTMYWWCRFDPQTELLEGETFEPGDVKSWLEHDAVIQGGELTSWPKLLSGDDLLLHYLQETKRLRKKIEGHLPGASEKTLAKMALFGVDCDHEPISGKEVYDRLMQGYMVSLRYSSLRPDLPQLLDEIHELGIQNYDRMMLNTDGSSASFYEQGMNDCTIRIAIEKGVPLIDAYNMATINIARYYNIEHLHGNIATGRVANINFLTDKNNPTPVSVIAKGKWVKRDNQMIDEYGEMDWEELNFNPLNINWELNSDDLDFSMPFGINLENSVITKPYSITTDIHINELSADSDECFFALFDKNGKWRVNTLLRGFANQLQGLASTYSFTGDIVLIGKNKFDMISAFNRLKEIGGGIVVSENQNIVHEIPLPLKGIMSKKPMEELIVEQKKFIQYLMEKGYQFNDPLYSLQFFSSTHLPYIRITQQGIYDVKNKTILFPTMMR